MGFRSGIRSQRLEYKGGYRLTCPGKLVEVKTIFLIFWKFRENDAKNK